MAEPIAIHDLDADLTRRLAEDYGIHTVREPRDPGSLEECSKQLRIEEELGRLATNTHVSMASTPGFENAGNDMGPKLARAFNAVTGIHADGVHHTKAENGKVRVAARRMTFAVAGEEEALSLNLVLQTLLRTHALDEVHPTYMPLMPQGSRYHEVVVHNMNEHIARVLDTAVGELVARSDYERYRHAVLPPDKRSLEYYKSHAETFPGVLEARLQAADDAYQRLRLSATYDGRPGMKPVKDPNLLATDPAPAFQGMRNIFNPLIWELRGDSTHNEEQDPNKNARLLIEQGVDIRRDPATPADIADGPGRSRAATRAERSYDDVIRALEYADRHKIQTSAKLAAKAVGAGIESLAGLGVWAASLLSEGAKQSLRDRREWKKRKTAYIHSARHIGSLMVEL